MFTTPAQAQTPMICFNEVPYCIGAPFDRYWQDNGGLPVFGLPLTNAGPERVEGEMHLVQHFERARFERHRENPPPYNVLLGRLGVDMLLAQGRDWQTFPKADPSAPHYFPETGHAVAPQFWNFYATHGLEFDGNKRAKSLAESIALFGLPVSEPQMEQGSDGNMYLTQWYERARFEHHPENAPPYDVLLGRLGAELLQRQAQPPQPAPPPGLPGIPAPSGNCVANAPPATEGPQAWVTNLTPQAPQSFNSLCARLILNGAVVSGAQVTAVAHYEGLDVNYGPATTGGDGVAEIGFNIGNATRHFVVLLDVTIAAPNGQTYTAETDFEPDYPLSGQPPGGPGLPGIPVPTGNCVANAPPPAEGAQAWMTVPQAVIMDQFNSVCARLIVNGAVVSGAQVMAIGHSGRRSHTYGPATTGADGVAEIGFNVSNFRNRSFVFVDVIIQAPGGQTYTAVTYFRLNYPETP
jgi:hypothetical protein